MENRYTITDISSICKVSKQSLYKFINKNKTFIDENSTRYHRIVYYNQTAMDFFISYYCPEQTQEITNDYINQTTAERRGPEGEKITAETRAPEGGENPSVEAPQEDKPPEDLNALQRKIDALEAELKSLRKQLDASEAEKKELLRQNGEVLLLLQMEKQEKQLFLPAPRKTLTDKVKSLFHKK